MAIERYQFGDFFTYECSNDLIGGRIFYTCQLLKDAYEKKKGDWIDILGLDIPGRIYFNSRENIVGIFRKAEPSLRSIQTDVYSILLKDVNKTCFELWSDIEDKYGVCFSLRTCIFIDQYMISLRIEFEKNVKIIQRIWKRVVSDPNSPVCQRRLMREFLSM